MAKYVVAVPDFRSNRRYGLATVDGRVLVADNPEKLEETFPWAILLQVLNEDVLKEDSILDFDEWFPLEVQ